MTEYRLFPDGEIPHVSTAAFHAHRPRAPHLEQAGHRPRLVAAAAYVAQAVGELRAGGATGVTVSDLGCGDGGGLSLVQRLDGVTAAWGYDFQRSNEEGWAERGVDGRFADVFGEGRDTVELGDVVVMTEVLEHIADPHGAVRWVGRHPNVRWIVASSPWGETPMIRDECHAWCWDLAGYADLIRAGGFTVVRHEPVGPFQLVLAVRE